MVIMEQKMDKQMDSLENLLRGFIAQTQSYIGISNNQGNCNGVWDLLSDGYVLGWRHEHTDLIKATLTFTT